MSKYKAKSLAGAERRVRQLERLVERRNFLLLRATEDRQTLARLAAETPQFFNPLVVMEAKRLRDSILKRLNNR